MDISPSGYGPFYTRVFTLSAVLLIGIACYQIMQPLLGPLLWAMLFALLLHPFHIRLQRLLGKHHSHSAWLLTLATTLAIIGPLTWIGSAFVQQATSLLHYLQTELSSDDLQHLTQQPLLQDALHRLQDSFGISSQQLRAALAEVTQTGMKLLATMSGQLFMGALGTAAGMFLTLFLLYFFIRDGVPMSHAARNLVPMRPDSRNELFTHLAAVTRAVVFGTGLTALIQGTLVGIAFAVTGLPSPVVFGVLAALLALLPFAGTALVWLPGAGVLALQGHWWSCGFMLAWGALLVSMIDNFLKPMLISGRAEVATLTVLLGVLGGVNAFGAIGLFLGPVMLALALALIGFALQARRAALHAGQRSIDNTEPDTNSATVPPSSDSTP